MIDCRAKVTYLRRHNFGVGSSDVDTSVEAGFVVGLDDVATVDFVGTDTAVVGSLRSGESVLWPTEWMQVVVEQRVFLFDTEPGIFACGRLHGLETSCSVVCLGRFLVVFVRIAEDQSVVAQVERIAVDGNRVQENVRIAAFRLVS